MTLHIDLRQPKGTVSDIIENGSLYEKITKVIEGYPQSSKIVSLQERLINCEIEDIFDLKEYTLYKDLYELTDEEFEKYHLISCINTLHKNGPKFIELLTLHCENDHKQKIQKEIKYLIDKYGKDFQDGLKFKLDENIEYEGKE